ncbi:MAG: 50S ribosomal protein L29 [Candidatus Pacebacteria bacterium]|nr:50S ribosomal protein L29 [Candidatus Paceibacterota bacterium]
MAKKLTFKDQSVEELNKALLEKKEELRKLRFEAAGARPKESNAPAKIRKDIARILTELTLRAKVSN